MHKKSMFSRRSCVFLILFLGMAAMGGTYSSWYSTIFAETKVTSGVMDVIFSSKVSEKYSAYITDINGNDETPLEAEFNTTDKELEVVFKEGLPVNSLLEGKLLKLEFPLDTSEDSTVNKLNHTELELTKTGDIIELQADRAMMIYNGVGYSLDENKEAFTQPLQFEVYKTLDEESKSDIRGQIYLKMTGESIKEVGDLPTKLNVESEALSEIADLDLNEYELIGTMVDGVMVTYSCEIPFDVFQSGSKVEKSLR